MKLLRTFLLVFFALLIAGCSTFRMVSTQEAPDFNLSEYSLYNYYSVQIDTVETPEFYERIRWIAEEIDDQFELRGVSRSKTDPDLLVNVGLVFAERTQTYESDFRTDAPKYMGSMNYAWESEDVPVGDYTEGTFVMHLVDAETNALLWEGIMQGVVLEKDKKTQNNITKAVNELFNAIK